MKLILGVFVLWIGLGLGLLFFVDQSYYRKPIGAGTNSVIFSVSSGESFLSICKRLEEKKLITYPALLNVLARFNGVRSKIRAGEYAVNDGMSPREILRLFTTGKSINYPFTVTEGLNSYEIAINFEKKGYGTKNEFLAACTDRNFLKGILGEEVHQCEGYLYPDTYNFEKRTTARQMVERMVRSFLDQYKEVARDRTVKNWSRHQVVTFASMIEKETGAPEERPLIASVFFNRLQKGMRLQTDPTVQYGVLATTGHYPLNITRKDLANPTPYNTYTKEGLPFGPISNPGRKALEAVFEPAQSEYLFFVSRNDGTHVFTKSYQEHTQAVRSFQLDPKARQGKSWRDLKSKK